MLFSRKKSPLPSPKNHHLLQLLDRNRCAFKTRCNLQIKRAQHSPMSLSPERSKPHYVLGGISVLLKEFTYFPSFFFNFIFLFSFSDSPHHFPYSPSILITFELQRSIFRWTCWTKPSYGYFFPPLLSLSPLPLYTFFFLLFPNMAVCAYAHYLHKSFVYC